MSETPLFKLFEQTINRQYKLKPKGTCCYHEEGQDKQGNKITYQFTAPTEDFFGFKLDIKKFNLFDCKLKGVCQRCDVVMVCCDNEIDYIIPVEIKTGNQDDYLNQISNGRHFCKWVVKLLKEHGYYSKHPRYLGLLVWKVNEKQTPKATTTQHHRNITQYKEYKGMKIYQSKSKKSLLSDLIKQNTE